MKILYLVIILSFICSIAQAQQYRRWPPRDAVKPTERPEPKSEPKPEVKLFVPGFGVEPPKVKAKADIPKPIGDNTTVIPKVVGNKEELVVKYKPYKFLSILELLQLLGLPKEFIDADKNGDGQIGMYEWDLSKLSDYDKYDLNGDGYITPQEYLRVCGKESKHKD